MRASYVSGGNWQLRSEAKDAFEAMAKGAYETFVSGQRVDLYCVSGYRSFANDCVVPSPCLGFSEAGTCTGSVLEWCKDGAYARVDCGTKTDGRTACAADANPALGMNCVAP